MSRLNSLWLILAIFVLSLTSAFALSEDFTIQSTTLNPAACSFSVTANSVIVTNTGDIESVYSLSAVGSAGDFTTYSDSRFSLQPGETKYVYVYYAPGSRTGNYYIETTVITDFGKAKTIKHNVAVDKCTNVNVNIKTPIAKINPCEVAQFSFDIKNAGDFTETYDFGVKGLEEYATLSTPSIVLNPGEQKQVDVFINPDCGIYGNKEITFLSFARTTQYLAEAKVTLDITQAYDYEVKIPAENVVCNYKQASVPIEIKNNVKFLNQYDVKVSGPSWLKQEAYKVELSGNSKGTTQLVALNPTNPGEYFADVKIVSVRGDVVKEGESKIIVENCYDSDLNIDVPADILVQGHTQTYKVSVKNTGTKQDTYEFVMESPVWVSSDAQKTVLKAGETKTFTITAKANETGAYQVKFTAKSAETAQEISDVLKFKVISPEDAYKASIKIGYSRVLFGAGSIPVKITNDGILPATYDLTIGNVAFAKLEASTITLQPGETAVTKITTNAQEKNEIGDYVTQLVATVKGEGIGFSSKLVIKLREMTLMQEMIVLAVKYWIVLAVVAALLLLALFWAIFGRRISRAWRNARIRRAEVAKFNKELRAKREEEKRAEKMLKEAMKLQKQQLKETQKAQKSGFWSALLGLILVILALAIIAAGFLAAAGYMPFITEMFKQKTDTDKFAPIIKVNTTGLEAYGNTVIVRG
ncbi:hypothetical protein JXB27_00785, partial [Candidatus Woesearchaeota archaeon]|nr:hypothetical protein [Candidatus Woesearchaeota archaeon]